MATFPAIERYRAELLTTSFTPLSDPELAIVRQRDAEAHHSSAIEGIHPTAEMLAFDALMIELRVPLDLAERFSKRFSQERIVGPALARQREMENAKLRA